MKNQWNFEKDFKTRGMITSLIELTKLKKIK